MNLKYGQFVRVTGLWVGLKVHGCGCGTSILMD